MFTHPGVTWVSWRLTSPCVYVGMMETHVLQVTWILWKPISSPGNLGVMEICPPDPRRAHALLFLSAHMMLLPHSPHGLCPASSLLAQRGVEEKRSFPIFPANWGRGGQTGMGSGREAPAYLTCWDCTGLLQQHSHHTGGQEKPGGPERECEVVKSQLSS